MLYCFRFDCYVTLVCRNEVNDSKFLISMQKSLLNFCNKLQIADNKILVSVFRFGDLVPHSLLNIYFLKEDKNIFLLLLPVIEEVLTVQQARGREQEYLVDSLSLYPVSGGYDNVVYCITSYQVFLIKQCITFPRSSLVSVIWQHQQRFPRQNTAWMDDSRGS